MIKKKKSKMRQWTVIVIPRSCEKRKCVKKALTFGDVLLAAKLRGGETAAAGGCGKKLTGM
jgi:hypothetical protein